MDGKFIIIEGTDGSGKTTQLNLLKKYLEEKGEKVYVLDFPKYDEFWGRMVGNFMRGEYGELDDVNPYIISPIYLLDQAEESKKIVKYLKEGYFVLSNRYVTSSMAHQTAKFKSEGERRKFLDWLLEAAYKKLGLIKEDLTIVLYIDPAISMKLAVSARTRKGKYTVTKDIAEDHAEHQISSAAVYKQLTEEFDTWELVDCMQNEKLMPIDDIHRIVADKIDQMLESNGLEVKTKNNKKSAKSKQQLTFV